MEAVSAQPRPVRVNLVRMPAVESDDSWDDLPTHQLVDLSRPSDSVAVVGSCLVDAEAQSEFVESADVGVQSEAVVRKEKGVQSPPSLLRELIPMSANAIGRLVVENPHENSQAIMRRIQATHGVVIGMAHILTPIST
jgi:hypothetical protein